MPSRNWEFRLKDIIESIDRIEKYLNGVDLEEFQKNSMISDAVVRNFEVIGEACNHIPEDVQSKYSTIPWNQMRGMRNILIHEYFGVDIPTVWHTSTEYLPPLKKELQEILTQLR